MSAKKHGPDFSDIRDCIALLRAFHHNDRQAQYAILANCDVAGLVTVLLNAYETLLTNCVTDPDAWFDFMLAAANRGEARQ